jgi:FkbM family methyltransferase
MSFIFFKNILINKPASFFSPRIFIKYIKMLSGFRLHSYNSHNLEGFPNLKIHEVVFDSKKIYFQSETRISRFMRGFEHAGRRMWLRYKADQLLNGETPKTLIDIGSNIGEFSYFALYKYKPNIDIFCFDPDPVAIKCIENNLPDFDFNLNPIALSDKNGESTFWLKPESADSSLHKSFSDSVEFKVQTRTLDQVFSHINFSRPALLKMDAEGHEPEVLEGGRKTLERIDFVTIDGGLERSGNSTSSEVARILHETGFNEVSISGNHIVTGRRNS